MSFRLRISNLTTNIKNVIFATRYRRIMFLLLIADLAIVFIAWSMTYSYGFNRYIVYGRTRITFYLFAHYCLVALPAILCAYAFEEWIVKWINKAK